MFEELEGRINITELPRTGPELACPGNDNVISIPEIANPSVAGRNRNVYLPGTVCGIPTFSEVGRPSLFAQRGVCMQSS
jgi:hypothetical protein